MYDSSSSSEMPEVDAKRHVAIDASHYPMDHPRRGIAAIFNVMILDGQERERNGSEVDVRSLRRSFTRLGFKVKVFIDRTVAELESILEALRGLDHSNSDCFVLVYMSHGLDGQLRARDCMFDANLLWDPFTAKECPSLTNKPKLFIIQACQGHSKLGAVRVGLQLSEEARRSGQAVEDINLVPTCLMPACTDFLIAFSTIPGHKSWRDAHEGSWYIQSLCRRLDSDGFTEDVLTLLTHVARDVALNYTYYDSTSSHEAGKKQLPTTTSLLLRVLKLTRKHQVKNCVKRRNTGSDVSDCDENNDERSPLPLETTIHQSIAGLEEEGDRRISASPRKRAKK